MSEDGRGRARRDEDGRVEPPMLLLGDDRPDVEDTTAEELARQREELERRRRQLEEEDRRRRREAEEEAERLRRAAAEKLAEERRQAEIELARRQRELDHAERQLSRTERRLRQKARRTGAGSVPTVTSPRRARRTPRALLTNSLLAAAERRSGVPVPRMPVVATLAVVASSLLVAGAVLSVDPPAPEDVERFVVLDETRVGWLQAGTTLDEEVVRYLSGEEVTSPDGTLPSVALAEEVAAATDRDWHVEDFMTSAPPLLAQPGSSPQRVLSAWAEARDSAGTAVPSYEVGDASEVLDADRALPTWLLLGGVLALGGLAWSLGRGRAWVGVGLAGLALVPAGLVLADQDRHLDVEPALEAHDEAVQGTRQVYELMGRDLEAVYGTRALDRWEQEEYWVGRHYSLEDLDPAATSDYVGAREALTDVDVRSLTTEQSLPYAEALVEAGGALLAAETAALTEARGEVVARTVSTLEVGPYAATTAVAALLPLAALVPAALRRHRVQP